MAKFDWKFGNGLIRVDYYCVADSPRLGAQTAEIWQVSDDPNEGGWKLAIVWLGYEATLPVTSSAAALSMASQILEAWGFSPVEERE